MAVKMKLKVETPDTIVRRGVKIPPPSLHFKNTPPPPITPFHPSPPLLLSKAKFSSDQKFYSWV